MKALVVSKWAKAFPEKQPQAEQKRPVVVAWNSLVIIIAILSGCFYSISANALLLNLDQVLKEGQAGTTVIFTGSITNDTGQILDTSADLFMDFSGYDPGVLDPTDLVNLSNIILNPGDTSPSINLFSFGIDPTAPPGLYDGQVSIQDVIDLGDASGIYNVQVRVIPEPATVFLMVGLLPWFGLVKRKRTLR